MKINNALSNVLDGGVKVACLRHLCLFPAELNGRQLSRLLNITPKSIHKAMSTLVNEGVIDLTPHGNSFGYSLSRKSWLVNRLLLPLFQSERVFLDILIQQIKKMVGASALKGKILSVVLFGSVQKKQDHGGSDLDLFVLVDKENNVAAVEEEIQKIGTSLMKEHGIGVGPYIKSLAEFKKDKSIKVIRSIVSSNRLIFGKEISTYVR